MTPRHTWHRAWALDAPNARATHTPTGLVCRFEPLPVPKSHTEDLEASGWQAFGKCWMPPDKRPGPAGQPRPPDGRQWGVVATQTGLQDALGLLVQQHGQADAPARLARLARQAGELWVFEMRQQRDRPGRGYPQRKKAPPTS